MEKTGCQTRCLSGQLMKGTGLEELLGSAFKGVSDMLNGKSWPKAMRGLRMVVAALIKNAISEETTANEIEVYLNRVRAGSLIGGLWVDCLIQPVLIIQAKRQADWLLHLYCLQKMLRYFLRQTIKIMLSILLGIYCRFLLGCQRMSRIYF